ncbi:MAG: helix-turn-helix transcriptional regulator, partial [Eubacteriaceae bacterium]|nr:helix-turn-helix transcriptional regulator [Eubacteriaceae bacterium]
MFINKTEQGLNNLCGPNVKRLRLQRNLSQRQLAEKLQLVGLDVEKNAIQRMECGKRFVTDIELAALMKVFGVGAEELMG